MEPRNAPAQVAESRPLVPTFLSTPHSSQRPHRLLPSPSPRTTDLSQED